MAFLRVCSGRFEKDMIVYHPRHKRKIQMTRPHRLFARERDTIEEAFPGDVIGVVNPGLFVIGDTVTAVPAIEFFPLPNFPPEYFATGKPSSNCNLRGWFTRAPALERTSRIPRPPAPMQTESVTLGHVLGALRQGRSHVRGEYALATNGSALRTAYRDCNVRILHSQLVTSWSSGRMDRSRTSSLLSLTTQAKVSRTWSGVRTCWIRRLGRSICNSCSVCRRRDICTFHWSRTSTAENSVSKTGPWH